MPPIINKQLCDGCGLCTAICPLDVYFGSKRKEVPTVSYPYECWHCNACVIDCPRDAIKLRIPAPMMVVYK